VRDCLSHVFLLKGEQTHEVWLFPKLGIKPCELFFRLGKTTLVDEYENN
jgi:hypothetical protein